MKKIRYAIIFLLLIMIPFHFIISSDNNASSKELVQKECLMSLENYIIENSCETIPCYSDNLLNPAIIKHIRSEARTQTHPSSNDLYRYIDYKGHLVCFNDELIKVLHKNGTQKTLALQMNRENKIKIKSLSFNKKGNILAAINPTHMYVWDLLTNDNNPLVTYACEHDSQDEESVNTYTRIALNDDGQRAAFNVQNTCVQGNSTHTSHYLIIIDPIKNITYFRMCLNTFYPTTLYFLNNHQLVHQHKKDDKKIFDLNQGSEIIARLSNQQKSFIYTIYEQYYNNEEHAQQKGLYNLIAPRIKVLKTDPNYTLFMSLEQIIKAWLGSIADIEDYNTDQDCVIS